MCRTLGANLDGDHSVKCPICGTWTEVKLTRQKDGFVLRSRVCGNEHRFSTEERHVPSNQHGGARFRNVEPCESGEISQRNPTPRYESIEDMLDHLRLDLRAALEAYRSLLRKE